MRKRFSVAFSVAVLGCLALNLLYPLSLREKVVPSVAFILTENEKGGGTGFIVDAKSGKQVLITNKHVCDGTKKDGAIKVRLSDDRKVFLRIIEISTAHDLCIVEAPSGIPSLRLGSEPKIGDTIHLVGHPFLTPTQVTHGEIYHRAPIEIVTKALLPGPVQDSCAEGEKKQTIPTWFFTIDVCIATFDALYMNAFGYPGNSGSPVVNDSGKVIGVLFAGNDQTNWSNAVPLEYLKALLEKY